MVISALIKNAKHPLLTGHEDSTQSKMQEDLIGFELYLSPSLFLSPFIINYSAHVCFLFIFLTTSSESHTLGYLFVLLYQ